MRAPLISLALVCLLAAPAGAGQDDPRLEGLFEALHEAPSAELAQPIERQIWIVWSERADAQSETLMRQGQALMRAQQLDRAEASFDALIRHDPQFAEAWNKRATVRFMDGELGASLADIEKVLELEPRHFGALSGMGLVLMQMGRDEAALRAFEAALEVNPFLAGAKAHVEMLEKRLLGVPT